MKHNSENFMTKHKRKSSYSKSRFMKPSILENEVVENDESILVVLHISSLGRRIQFKVTNNSKTRWESHVIGNIKHSTSASSRTSSCSIHFVCHCVKDTAQNCPLHITSRTKQNIKKSSQCHIRPTRTSLSLIIQLMVP